MGDGEYNSLTDEYDVEDVTEPTLINALNNYYAPSTTVTTSTKCNPLDSKGNYSATSNNTKLVPYTGS